MPSIEWSDRFSVGIKEMDQQHKKLIDLINCLHDQKLAHNAQEGLSKIFNELMDYTKTHFKREEELMKLYEYPGYTIHKNEHFDLVQQVLDMRRKYHSSKIDIATDVAILLSDWLAEHILIEDKKYGAYISSNLSEQLRKSSVVREIESFNYVQAFEFLTEF